MSNRDKNQPRKLLVVLAHPDDESFICGGALAKYAAEGVDITLISATRGEMGRRMGNPPYLNRETIPFAREIELRAACDSLGIRKLIFFDIRDKTVEFQDEKQLTERIAAHMREIDPDVVLTFHETLGGHPDHCAIGKAATAAFFQEKRRGALYFITYGDGLERRPERYGCTREDVMKVDVSEYLQAKLAAFRAHRCQSEIDEWVWLPDSEALARFGRHEYFMNGRRETAVSDRHDLFSFDDLSSRVRQSICD